MKFLNQGFDHVEFVVNDASLQGRIYERMGFEKLGERRRDAEGSMSVLYGQGWVRILLTQPVLGASAAAWQKSNSMQFLRSQAEGICVLAVEVDDASMAFHEAVSRGARPAMEPRRFDSPQGSVVRSEIWSPGQVRYAFIERRAASGNSDAALFDEGLVARRLESPSPFGIFRIDHLTNNVAIGEMSKWVEWYQRVFGFKVTRHFDIRTGRTGLVSDVVQSECGRIIVPINEATEPASQVQEFVDRMKGAGVQHLALETTGLPATLRQLRSRDFKFLTVPHTYYEAVPTRVQGVTEDLGEMEQLGILLDGEGEGYLLQIFSEEILGPFFFEFIQRKGNQGFGEGNFRALFEAIERDQVRRGVL
jgi:4-hydroxyphenylpyruvate dioxygenase